MNDDKALYPPVDPIITGIKGLCPRCGQEATVAFPRSITCPASRAWVAAGVATMAM